MVTFNRNNLTFAVLNLVEGALVGVIPIVVESRVPAMNWCLGILAVAMIVSCAALLFGGRIGRIYTAGVCLVYFVAGVVFTGLVLSSASYLSTIYGHHGHAAAALALVVSALTLVGFWLIPAHELVFLRRQWGKEQ